MVRDELSMTGFGAGLWDWVSVDGAERSGEREVTGRHWLRVIFVSVSGLGLVSPLNMG